MRGRHRRGRTIEGASERAEEFIRRSIELESTSISKEGLRRRSLIGVLNQGHRLPIENRAQDERTYRRGESTVNGDEKRSEGRAIERNRIFSVEEECDQSEGEFLGWNEE